MPLVSKAQRRWAHSEAGVKALGGEAKVAEWEKETKGKKLPERKKAPEPKVRLRHTATPR
jgi:hypothetical protein